MISRKKLWAFVGSLFAGMIFPLLAFSGNIDLFDEPDEKPWQENEMTLPAFPEKEDLIPFKVGAVTIQQFFIDGKSISVGSDEVIRYTLVLVGSGGAQNVTFEGMRCATMERRIYAYGRTGDRTWAKARNDDWGRIPSGSNRVHFNLFSDYFCNIGEPAIMTPEDARRALRYNRSTTLR